MSSRFHRFAPEGFRVCWLAPGLGGVPSLCPGSATAGACSETKFCLSFIIPANRWCPAAIPQAIAACLSRAARRILSRMGIKSRTSTASVRAAAERATEARKEADKLACEAWNKRMLGFQGPAQGPAGNQGQDPHAGAL
jgi:hypothetical protein